MASTSAWESPAMASSEIKSRGFAAMARASSSFRMSIPVRSAGRACALASSPMSRRISMASEATADLGTCPWAAYSSGMQRFSSTVMLVNGRGIWKLRQMPSRVR